MVSFRRGERLPTGFGGKKKKKTSARPSRNRSLNPTREHTYLHSHRHQMGWGLQKAAQLSHAPPRHMGPTRNDQFDCFLARLPPRWNDREMMQCSKPMELNKNASLHKGEEIELERIREILSPLSFSLTSQTPQDSNNIVGASFLERIWQRSFAKRMLMVHTNRGRAKRWVRQQHSQVVDTHEGPEQKRTTTTVMLMGSRALVGPGISREEALWISRSQKTHPDERRHTPFYFLIRSCIINQTSCSYSSSFSWVKGSYSIANRPLMQAVVLSSAPLIQLITLLLFAVTNPILYFVEAYPSIFWILETKRG